MGETKGALRHSLVTLILFYKQKILRMKKLITIVFIFSALSLSMQAQAQDNAKDGSLQKYRRSSLATMMVYHPEDEFGKDIREAYEKIPVPDKYDDHDMGLKVLENEWFYNVQGKDKSGLYKASFTKKLTASNIEKNGRAIEQFLNKSNVGLYMVAKWFNISSEDPATATFNMELIKERGQYDATALDVQNAKLTTRGLATLSDAGEELLGQTFILINDMTYVTAEERAAAAKVALGILGAIGDAFTGDKTGSNLAQAASDFADSFTGFKVMNHSYLYQLQWNDSVAAIFYNNYYTEVPDEAKMSAFMNDTSLFKVKYVAHEYEFDSNSTFKGKYERSDLVKLNCTRSQDKNVAALQVAYEDFKLKTPIYEVKMNDAGKIEGYTAKVGMKEGITEKSKFQVIQRIVDPNTNKTRYKYVATLKPVKGKIWDNRYMAAEEKSDAANLDATFFKKAGGGDIYPGMLIIEGKYRKVEE